MNTALISCPPIIPIIKDGGPRLRLEVFHSLRAHMLRQGHSSDGGGHFIVVLSEDVYAKTFPDETWDWAKPCHGVLAMTARKFNEMAARRSGRARWWLSIRRRSHE